MKIWVDDVRPMPKGYDLHIKSVNDAIEVIGYIEAKQHQRIDLLDLDHDAGDYYDQGGDYIRILDWMEFEGINDIPISIHSGNLVGIRNMQRIIQKNGWKYVFAADENPCDIIM